MYTFGVFWTKFWTLHNRAARRRAAAALRLFVSFVVLLSIGCALVKMWYPTKFHTEKIMTWNCKNVKLTRCRDFTMLLLVRIHITLYTYAHSTYKMMIRLHTYLSNVHVSSWAGYVFVDWLVYLRGHNFVLFDHRLSLLNVDKKKIFLYHIPNLSCRRS